MNGKFGALTIQIGLCSNSLAVRRALRYAPDVKHVAPFLAALLLDGSANAAGRVVYAGPAWAAIDLGASCEARARSELLAPKGKVQANAGFAFTPDHRRWGEFHAHLSRLPRPASSVMLAIGKQDFLLVERGGWAWASSPAQDRAIIDLARISDGFRIRFRDTSGRRYTDSYSLAGAPTAIDAAAAACAGKMPPR